MSDSSLQSKVSISSNSVDVSICDPRTDTLQTFEELDTPQQEQLAHDAWHVGLRALTNAYRQGQEARLQDIGRALRDGLDEQLQRHANQQQKEIGAALTRYFDPKNGELGTRLSQFIGDEGTLVHLLQKHLGPRNSVLVETLTKHVGDQSPLFRRLSPTDREGLVCVLDERLRAVLQEEHHAFQKALDPMQEDGAVGRFITQLRKELERAEDDQAKQLKVALAALDTEKEDSLLNQLRRDTQQARTDLMQAINPAHEGSPLAIIRTQLTELLRDHAKSTRERLDEARKHSDEFQRDVREALQRIETRRSEEQRSAHGGGLFEDEVAEFAQRQLASLGYVVDTTGSSVGLRPSCKVGDVVIGFPPDHAFAEHRVVIEAKRDRSYNVSKALDELGVARANRGAGSGIFVMSRSHAGAGFPSFARYGHDIIVVWDNENPSTDPYLQAALMVALGLASRTKSMADKGDLDALRGIENRILSELNRLDKIRSSAEKIRKQAESIESEVGKGEKKLRGILEGAKKTLTALNVELDDEELELSPIKVNAYAPENDSSAPVAMAEE